MQSPSKRGRSRCRDRPRNGGTGSGQTDRSGRPRCCDRHLTPDARRGRLEAVLAGLRANYLYPITGGTFGSAFDFVVCQQGLQFFPDRLAALSEMRRALKPEGQLAIAAWSHIGDNPFYAALHAALCESVPGDLADRLLAPFSGPDAQVLKNTVEAAGFHEIRVRSVTLPLIFEGGIAQAARAIAASPLAPSLATLPAGTYLG